MSTQIDRITGLVGNLGVKAPCNCASVGALTLVGEQTVDGYACTAADNGGMGTRVLYKDDPNPVLNGIYYCNTGAWQRAPDFDGQRDVAQGTRVFVTGVAGVSTNVSIDFEVTTANPVNVGTSGITFASYLATSYAPVINAAPAKNPLAAADKFGIWDSITGLLKSFSWANLQAQILALFSAPSGSSLIGYQPAGTGSVATTEQERLRRFVDVLDYGADPTGVADSTAAFVLAHNVSPYLIVGKGTWSLNNYRPINGETWQCAGYDNTIIKQGNAANPALNILSDVSSGQLIGLGLTKFSIVGANAATVHAVICKATSPYVVSFSDFDYHASNVFGALKILVAAANEVYSNKFNVYSITNSGVPFITAGVYNEYKIEAVACATGQMLSDSSLFSTFSYLVSDGTFDCGGQSNTFISPRVETIYGVAAFDSCAIRVSGYNHTVISPQVINVAAAKSPFGFRVFNSHTIIQPEILGPALPTDPIVFDAASNATIIGGSMPLGVNLEQYVSAAILWNTTLLGDVSTYSLQHKNGISQPVNNLATATTYTLDASITALGFDSVLMFGAAATATLTLPSGAAWAGREVVVFTTTAQTVVSASANIKPMTGVAGTAILAATIGKWARLKADATAANWYIIENN